MRRALGTVVALGVAAAALIGAENQASASLIDVGGQLGMQQRYLANTQYKVGFAWQLHADLALLPPILMLGAYLEQQAATPKPKEGVSAAAGTSLDPITFRAIGARAKLKLPIPGPFKPYGIAGIGWVHGDFPPYKVQRCAPPPAPAGSCASVDLPNLAANFVEFQLGGGLMIDIAGPLVLTLEFAWRPTTGYSNDTYEQTLANQQANPSAGTPSPPSPSKNGFSYTGFAGLAISF